ncbi:phage terminase large subunit [Vitreoscilla massiliensis]|uniref:Phage terminase large subunit n=1 Tax=Vitreoscilla massiliensis TaxID=1689272 RepID=A0ABY4E3V8_9NEIS|nr:phage terminase large subunit [Vitreoscilla massiliensis]UOO89520.1 phage terminase large subunit [Vitreoscilla massiliensis]
MSQTARIELPPKLIPVFASKSRYKGAHGGRGSAKTRTFALMSAVKAYQAAQAGISGTILCGREFMNSLEDSSMEEVKQAIHSIPWLNDYFDIGEKYIRTKNGLVSYSFCGLRTNLDSIKSKARILVAWVDEAETVSDIAWKKLTPTVRENDSEVWVTWNPEAKGSATDTRFRVTPPSDAIIVEMNYTDNPWFPAVLEQERLDDMRRLSPEEYAWIWEGAYRTQSEAQVFRNKYRIQAFEPQSNWQGPYYGLDFGFANDPTAGVECYINGNTLHIRRECGKTGLELDATAPHILRHMPNAAKYPMRADSARPESISYLKRHGLPKMVGVKKGKGSVEDGIEFMKSFDEIIIHPDCKQVASEFRLYSYKTDRLSGDVLPVLMDEHNHWIDAARYALEPIMKKRGSFKQTSIRMI